MKTLSQQEINTIWNAARHSNFIRDIKYREKQCSHDVYYFHTETNFVKKRKYLATDVIGYGFIDRSDKSKHICLARCPACKRENWSPNILRGICTWCPFDANNDITDIPDKELINV